MAKKTKSKATAPNNGFVHGLKTEWNLFWETILGDEPENSNKIKDPFVTGKVETLSLEQIKAITKALSSDRKKLNQQLELLSKEIAESTTKLETVQRINQLNDLGQELSEQLDKINERLKIARHREDGIKKAAREA